MTFVVGVGFDRDRLLAQLVGQIAIALELLELHRTQFFSVLFDHPFVVVGRDRRHALRQQVVASEAGLDFDDIALLAEVFDVVDQQQVGFRRFRLWEDVCRGV